MKSKIAFTLAEVLVTLAIIGVVAALTLPSLIANYQEKARINQVIAAYAKLSEATKRIILDEGELTYWGSTAQEIMSKYKDILPKYIETVRVSRDSKNDFNNVYYMKNGLKVYEISEQIYGGSPRCTLKSNYSNVKEVRGVYFSSCGTLKIDINGDRKPNKYGVDRFMFYVVADGIVPDGHPKEDVSTKVFDNSVLDKNLTSWVIFNKNMDYLHCNDLSWENKTKCK